MKKGLNFTWGNVITIILALFAAGTAWGVSNAQASNNVYKIESLQSELSSHEEDIKGMLEGIETNISILNIRMAEVAKDIQWIKENSD
tara:strand:- start:3021 stop:3284 length:264 start_codon:yes stop_codon:yes gene_type:complete